MSVKCIRIMTSVSSLISLVSFCLSGLSIGESGVLESPTISVCSLMCDLSFSDVSFTYVGALYLGHRCSGLKIHLGFFL